MKVLGIHNNSGARFYRINHQLKALRDAGHKVELAAHNDSNLLSLIAWADVVIFQMALSPDMASAARKLGKRVVFECDDLVHSVHKSHYAYAELKGIGGLRVLWNLYKTLRNCDLAIFSNKKLRRLYGWMAHRSFVFENYIELVHWMKERQENTSDEIRLLWAGSTSHTGDLLMIKPVLKRILTEYPNMRFVYVGHGGGSGKDPYSTYLYGEDLFDGLPANRESLLGVPANIWPYILSSSLADIAIAPLEKNRFNSYKTQCKFYEYGINKIPCVASRWFYSEIKHGETGFLAETEEEWYQCLKQLVEDIGLRVRIGENAYQYVLTSRDSNLHDGKWIAEIQRLHEPKEHHSPRSKKDGSRVN